jgi:hypothetical protein
MVSDLSKIPKEKFEIVESSKGNYYKISYQIEMRFEAMITFALKFDGKFLLAHVRVSMLTTMLGEIVGEISVDYSHSR